MRKLLSLLILVSLSACAGTGSVPLSPFVPSNAMTQTLRAHHRHHKTGAVARIIIPRAHHRRAHFISSATKAIKIVAIYLDAPGFTLTTIAALTTSSPDCTSSSSALVCVIAAQVFEGHNRIDVTTYDAAPVGGKIPRGAKILATSTVTQTVTAGKTPYVAIFLSGEIGSINAGPSFDSLPADGATTTAAIMVNPKDF